MALCSSSLPCSSRPHQSRLNQSRRRWAGVNAAISGQNQPSDNSLTAHEFFEAFLRDRRGTGDFITKTSDLLWRNEVLLEGDQEIGENVSRKPKNDSGDGSGYLRLSQAKSWSLGLDSPPTNADENFFIVDKERDDFRRICLLEYEALKRELSLITLAIGSAGTAYCLVFFSVETAVSYGIGVIASWIYLQLLAYQVDRTSAETVPQIFMKKKKTRRIGFTSTDLQESFERNFQGIIFGLWSPRLLLPIALYGLWISSNQLNNDSIISFKLQNAAMLLGLFAYKAAALVQTYRDNKDLIITFPEKTTDDEERYD